MSLPLQTPDLHIPARCFQHPYMFSNSLHQGHLSCIAQHCAAVSPQARNRAVLNPVPRPGTGSDPSDFASIGNGLMPFQTSDRRRLQICSSTQCVHTSGVSADLVLTCRAASPARPHKEHLGRCLPEHCLVHAAPAAAAGKWLIAESRCFCVDFLNICVHYGFRALPRLRTWGCFRKVHVGAQRCSGA